MFALLFWWMNCIRFRLLSKWKTNQSCVVLVANRLKDCRMCVAAVTICYTLNQMFGSNIWSLWGCEHRSGSSKISKAKCGLKCGAHFKNTWAPWQPRPSQAQPQTLAWVSVGSGQQEKRPKNNWRRKRNSPRIRVPDRLKFCRGLENKGQRENWALTEHSWIRWKVTENGSDWQEKKVWIMREESFSLAALVSSPS